MSRATFCAKFPINCGNFSRKGKNLAFHPSFPYPLVSTMISINKDTVLKEFSRLQEYFSVCKKTQNQPPAIHANSVSTFMPFESCLLCDHVRLDQIIDLVFAQNPVQEVLRISVVTGIYDQILLKAFDFIKNAQNVPNGHSKGSKSASMLKYIELVASAYLEVPLTCQALASNVILKVAEKNKFVAIKLASSLTAMQILGCEQQASLMLQLNCYQNMSLSADLTAAVKSSLFFSHSDALSLTDESLNALLKVDMSAISLDVDQFGALVSACVSLKDPLAAFYYILHLCQYLYGKPEFNQLVINFIKFGSYSEKEFVEWGDFAQFRVEIALLRVDLLNARFLSNCHLIQPISGDLLENFFAHFRHELEPYRQCNYLSSNKHFLVCLLESPKQLVGIGCNLQLATDCISKELISNSKSSTSIVKCIDLLGEYFLTVNTIVRIPERIFTLFHADNAIALYYAFCINYTTFKMAQKDPSKRYQIYSSEILETFDFRCLFQSLDAFGFGAIKLLTTFYPDLFDYTFLSRNNNASSELLACKSADISAIKSSNEISNWWTYLQHRNPVTCYQKFSQLITNSTISGQNPLEFLHHTLRYLDISLLNKNNFLFIPLLHTLSGLFERGQAFIKTHSTINSANFPSPSNQDGFLYLLHSMLIQNLFKLVQLFEHSPFVTELICEFIHEHFVKYDYIIQIIHLEKYPIQIIPIIVQKIPSLYILLEPARINELLKVSGIEFTGSLVAEIATKYPTVLSENACKLVIQAISNQVIAMNGDVNIELFGKFVKILTKYSIIFPHLFFSVYSDSNPYGQVMKSIQQLYTFTTLKNLPIPSRLEKLMTLNALINKNLNETFEHF